MSSGSRLSSLSIRQITTAETLALRHAVLWPNQPIEKVRLPEDDTPMAWHFGAFVNDADADPAAVISLFLENTSPLGMDTHGHPYARFRKFACATNMQGQGIGSLLLQYAIDFSKSLDIDGWESVKGIWCDARLETASWYEKRGMQRFGEDFYKSVGDERIEYVRMCKSFP
ncbi:hypothetical protein CYLTODRAFT_393090 [Cylindrobasidium torrendii FP15055 ss-10]|uniref:N-acetyltransferase domain-containing protein n=1 Tax=Cylindrobasidium torrendii FP15055 ss-10 TaxID=1314674 RepID=A0A0D7BHW9_9AGAR|nr:hypothetical protein CYLTODRAFT_393090 [Cylindrobasidium torrendii FP15055 ss-10]